MPDFLTEMEVGSRTRLEAARRAVPAADLRRRALDTEIPPRLVLDPTGFDLIAEVKRHAPSTGSLGTAAPGLAADQARAYAAGGAAAISVLTEPTRFAGNLDDLRAAAHAVRVPVMRKDFLVDPYQVFEARAHGAGGVLVIVRMLSDHQVQDLLGAAWEAALFVLLECFDDADVRRAVAALPADPGSRAGLLIGVNTRDLTTLAVRPERLRELAPALPADVPGVAESGLTNGDEVTEAAAYGYRLGLIGSALMRASNPATTVASLLRAGRAGVIPPCPST